MIEVKEIVTTKIDADIAPQTVEIPSVEQIPSSSANQMVEAMAQCTDQPFYTLTLPNREKLALPIQPKTAGKLRVNPMLLAYRETGKWFSVKGQGPSRVIEEIKEPISDSRVW